MKIEEMEIERIAGFNISPTLVQLKWFRRTPRYSLLQ